MADGDGDLEDLSDFLAEGDDLEDAQEEPEESYEEEDSHGDFAEERDVNDEETPERGEQDSRGPSGSPQRSGGSAHVGRNGPRSSVSSEESSRLRPRQGGGDSRELRDRDPRDSRSRSSKDSRKGTSQSTDTRSQKKPRGNLPQAPVFDGDRRKDPKCFKKYVSKVDSYVELARKIIDDSEIGLRLHAALEGEAMEFLEDVPARTFGVPNGWQILLRILKDKFDETKMSKVGSAMKNFFKLNLSDKQYTLREVADAMDKAAR
eukprot:s2476_g7.t1